MADGIPAFLQGGPDPSHPAPAGPTIDVGAVQQQFSDQLHRLNIERQEVVIEGGQRRRGLYHGQEAVAAELEHKLRTIMALRGVPEPRLPSPQETAAAFVEEQFPNRQFSEAELAFFNDTLNRKVAPLPATFETEKASLMASLEAARNLITCYQPPSVSAR